MKMSSIGEHSAMARRRHHVCDEQVNRVADCRQKSHAPSGSVASAPARQAYTATITRTFFAIGPLADWAGSNSTSLPGPGSSPRT